MNSAEDYELEGDYSGEDIQQPGFALQNGTWNGAESRILFMQTFASRSGRPGVWGSRPRVHWYPLATILPDKIIMRPVHAFPWALTYLKSRHGRIQLVTYEDDEAESLPTTAEEAVYQIERRLPWKMFRPCNHGLGLIKELDPLWQGLLNVPGLDTLVISESAPAALQGSAVRLPEKEVAALRRRFDRMKRIGRDRIRGALRWEIRNEVLPRLDDERFPRLNPEAAPIRLVELTRARSESAPARAAARASVSAVRENLQSLAQDEPRELMKLRADIELVTLESMIEKFDSMLGKQLTEGQWQQFFEDNRFILSLLFTRPVKLLRTQFHAQGSGLSGAGSQIGDFLFAEHSQSIAIVEIKKPSTPVTLSTPYRNTQVYAPHAEISGAVTQVLVQQNALRKNWYRHSDEDSTLRGLRSDVIRCIVIAGTTPTDEKQLSSFNVFRNASREVEVITFDELLGKLRLLRDHLSADSPESPGQVPS